MTFVRYSLILLSLVPVFCLAQSKIPILIDSTITDKDNVGRQLLFELKEAIRGSQAFRLVDDDGIWPRITIVMVSQDTSEYGTAASYSFLYDSLDMPMRGAFITAVVQNCGRDRVQSCARQMLSSIDGALERLNRRAPALRKTLDK